MPVKLYLDEDSMDKDLVTALRLRVVDVITALDANMIEKPDADHLTFAAIEGRVLYSFNVGDFVALHGEFMAAGKTHAGIVVAGQQKFSVGEQMRRLLRLVADRSEAEMRNRLEFLSNW